MRHRRGVADARLGAPRDYQEDSLSEEAFAAMY